MMRTNTPPVEDTHATRSSTGHVVALAPRPAAGRAKLRARANASVPSRGGTMPARISPVEIRPSFDIAIERRPFIAQKIVGVRVGRLIATGVGPAPFRPPPLADIGKAGESSRPLPRRGVERALWSGRSGPTTRAATRPASRREPNETERSKPAWIATSRRASIACPQSLQLAYKALFELRRGGRCSRRPRCLLIERHVPHARSPFRGQFFAAFPMKYRTA